MSIFKLDLYEYYYLDKKPRFQKTKKLLLLKKKHLQENIQNAVKYNKSFLIPLGLKPEVAQQEIENIKTEIFENKLHNGVVQFKRVLKRITNNTKKKVAAEVEFLNNIDVEKLSKARVIKIVTKIFNLKNLEKNPFVKAKWVIDGAVDKANDVNPSFFYNTLNNEERNYLSKILNNKELKQVNESVELSFKLILGYVAVKRNDTPIKQIEQEYGFDDDKREEDSDHSDIDESSSGDDMDTNGEDRDTELPDFNEDDFAHFDALVGGTDAEASDVELDANVDYNQVTDEEPSDDGLSEEESDVDDFFVEEPVSKKERKEKNELKHKKEKKKELAIPDLPSGYISGGESDIEQDELVEEITKPARKNRRGQRARQKMWEARFGRAANHIKKEKEEKQKLREQKQADWEERERKRQDKAVKSARATGCNFTPLGNKTGGTSSTAVQSQQMHPSWEAKKKQQEALKNIKFEGKKVKF